MGRPDKTDRFRTLVAGVLVREPRASTAELLRLARLEGFGGGKSGFYSMVAALRLDLARRLVAWVDEQNAATSARGRTLDT